ncbi:MAG: hypothetical protein D6762_07955 [Candidatus Neomarinimicrobiota bacterium]|nr:MAG: hypothetical protein D6762_07955 [Candidatus Neomarinimicrobiota bacterium]
MVTESILCPGRSVPGRIEGADMKRLILVLTLSLVWAQERPLVVTFNHELHVQELGVKCTMCHNPKVLRTSESSADRIMPTEKRCMKCHRTWKDDGDCDFCHLTDEPYPPFPPVTRNFQFSHKLHYAEKKIDCEQCHSDMTGVENRPPIPTMNDCLACHRERKGPQYCSACHENVATLRPANHGPDWIADHKVAALTETADCALCHTQLSCENCHSGSNLDADELPIMNPSPSFRTDLLKGGLLLERNHALDYEMNHGLDASTKAKDCQVCHDYQNFCTDCHQNEDRPILNKPDFHGGSDWGAVKYGDDPAHPVDFANDVTGGRHAEMARRDIELCASCHDVEGADPLCVDCHSDQDGVLNTDPATHEPNFMHDTQGDWCTETNSMCFVCHRRAVNKGDGFCGYCHQ